MRRFVQGNLSDMDVISAWLLSQSGDESFETLIEKRRHQVTEEIEQLSKSVIKLEIDDKDFQRMQRIYLTSKSENCSMKAAEEIITKLDMERTKKPEGSYAKIVESMRTPKPKYDIEKLDEEGQGEEPQVEWIRSGTVKLESLKKKYKEVK